MDGKQNITKSNIMADKKPKKRNLPSWMRERPTQTQYEGETSSAKQSRVSPPGYVDKTRSPSGVNHNLTLPRISFRGSITYSYHVNDCSILVQDILESSLVSSDCVMVVGFDMEWPVTFQTGCEPKTALLQICVDNESCYLFHLAYMDGLPKMLKKLLENDKVLKVGVGIESDMWKLCRDYEFDARQVIRQSCVDLSKMANKVLKSSQNWSLENLTRHVLGKDMDKHASIRCSDWSKYPLSSQQKLYAATDAWASLLLYRELQKRQSSAEVRLPQEPASEAL